VAIDLRTGGVEMLSNGAAEDWRVVLAETGEKTMTAARIRKALRYVRANSFFATYGDGVSDVDLSDLLAHHRRTGRPATVTAVHPSSRYGELAINGSLVRSFREKPQVNEGWINGGFMVFDRAVFEGLPAKDDLVLETDVLEGLARAGDLAVYQHGGFWQSMDTYREKCLLDEMWASGRAAWRIWDECRLSA
jgi:glucose-1-phosphate cytidylyltransferase